MYKGKLYICGDGWKVVHFQSSEQMVTFHFQSFEQVAIYFNPSVLNNYQ